MREGINKSLRLFSQRCLQTFFIFLSRAPRSVSLSLTRFARGLADVFEKNEEKPKQRLCTGFNSLSYFVFFFSSDNKNLFRNLVLIIIYLKTFLG